MIEIIIAIIALIIGAVASFMIQRMMANSGAKAIITEARIEAEGLKKDKIREGEKEAQKITNDAERDRKSVV